MPQSPLLARTRRLAGSLFLSIAIAVLATPVFFLAGVWWRDRTAPLPVASAGTNDASRLNPSQPAEVITVANDPAGAGRPTDDPNARARGGQQPIAHMGRHHPTGGHNTSTRRIP